MEQTAQTIAEKEPREASLASPSVPRTSRWLRLTRRAMPGTAKLTPVFYSIVDQGLAVGGGFLVNVALARMQTKEEYGIFVLSYSVFSFLLGLYYAAILEAFTVYGAGRYSEHFSEYLRLMFRSNIVFGVLLTSILLLVCLLLSWISPHLVLRAFIGLALTAGVLLSGYLLRRTFYLQRQPALAAKSSLVFFITVVCALWLAIEAHWLNSFSAFLVVALGWIVAGVVLAKRLEFGKPRQRFLELEPHYWKEHWNYSKWVLATAFVFQLTTQGYYWLVGIFLSAKEVANLRAMYILVGPVEQLFIAVSYLIVPALSGHYAAKKLSSFVSLWKLYLFATVAVTSVYAIAVRLVGKPIVHVLYRGKYDGLASYLFVLSLLPLVMWTGGTMAHALNAAEKPHYAFWAYVSSGIATFVVGIPLVHHFGLWGAVYGMLFSGTAYTVTLSIGFLPTVYDQL